MKKVLFIFMLICISCQASERNKGKTLNINKENISETQINDSIIGVWVISKTISTKIKYKNGTTTKIETETICNDCPTIIFNKNGKGILRNAVGHESSFKWVIDKDKILFLLSKKSDENSFFSTSNEFMFKIYNDSKNYFLELIISRENCRYVLIR